MIAAAFAAPAEHPALIVDLDACTVACPVCGKPMTWETWRDSDERGHFVDGQMVDAECDHDIDTGALLAAIADARRADAGLRDYGDC